MLVAFSGVQTATGHRSDIAAISSIARSVGAIVFVDGSQLVGALPVVRRSRRDRRAGGLRSQVSVERGSRSRILLSLAPIQDRFVPINAGWKAGSVPLESFFGPRMDLSPTASRFDNSISWLAAVGNEAALSVFDRFGAEAIYDRNRELAEILRASLSEVGWPPVDLPEVNRSSIVSVPLGDTSPRAPPGGVETARHHLLGPRRPSASGDPLLQRRGRHRSARERALASSEPRRRLRPRTGPSSRRPARARRAAVRGEAGS